MREVFDEDLDFAVREEGAEMVQVWEAARYGCVGAFGEAGDGDSENGK